jgi:uncharacterized protein (DUF58 family)
VNQKRVQEKPDEYAIDAGDKSRVQIGLEWLFHPKRRWARNTVTLGTAVLAVLAWVVELVMLSRVLAALFILMVLLRVVATVYLTVTGTRAFRKLFKARRLRFTNEGWWFVILTVGIGTAAMNTGVNLLYLILSMMLSFIVISGILSELTFRKLKISRSLPYSVFAVEQFDITLQIRNNKRVFPSFSLFVEDSPGSGPEFKKMKACYALKIPARHRTPITYPARIWKRGSFTLNGFRVNSGYPFNFFNKHMRLPGLDTILVYPRLYELNDTEILSGGERADALRKLNLRAHGEEDFRGLKEFREGDNPNHIHWVSSARHRKLMLKEFEKQRANRVIVVLDTFMPVGSPGKLEAFERAVSMAASLVTFFNKRNYQTGFAALAPRLVRVKPDSGRRHYFSLMEVLARLGHSTRRLEELVDRLDARELRDSMVFAVTLKDTLRSQKALRTLSLYSPVVKHICVTGDDFAKYVSLPQDGPECEPARQTEVHKAK